MQSRESERASESGQVLEVLRRIESETKQAFSANKRVMSFDEFFETFCDRPVPLSRTAAQYVLDCMDHYGRVELTRPEGTVTRFRLFDCPWDDGKYRLVGQEPAQNAVYRMLTNFIRDGRVTRLLLLHGPNGSAKSSFIQCIMRALEDYSGKDEGAIYRFNWVFPSANVAKKRLGFSGEGTRSLTSFAQLEDEDVDARLQGDLKDHPLLLLPRDDRRRVFESLREAGKIPEDFQIGEYLLDGDLSPRSRSICDALITAYHGDLQRVLQHVQVERFYFSRRYRCGAVTIEPQMHVDATIRQLTMDQGLHSLPPSLRSLSLFEPSGDLVDANRGVIEYNDLLKKPLDAFKYLLATCEKGTVTLPSAILHLDELFLASSNEKHLNAFKEYQDFTSFKGRMDLVKMPYLRDYEVEQAIYDEQIRAGGMEGLVGPHATFVVALWAVLTRLKRPRAEHYPAAIRDVVARLKPIEKAELYAGEREPPDLTPEQSRELRAVLADMLGEGQDDPDYEGSFGASPREMKQVMLHAFQNERYHGLSPLAIFDELRALVKNRSVYEFLKIEPQGGYHDHTAFIDQVFQRYLDHVNNDVRSSMGLVSEEQYEELFGRYILHVSYLLKGEKIYNDKTGSSEPPDTHLMDRLERIWDAPSDRARFRRDLVSRVGAWRIDFPGEVMNYRRLFPKLFEALERDYYERQKSTIRKVSEHVLDLLAEEEEPDKAHHAAQRLDAAERERGQQVIDKLEREHGYPRRSIREALGALLRHRY